MFERVLMHLRKSRADIEAEARGEGETLAKHEKFLLRFAKENNINVINIRRELESGESLIHRPKMLLTLQEVEQGMYDGVLCMDIDRLGRGNMIDQGVILQTFKQAGTKIITPSKIYDLNNEFDEDMTEYRAFFARKELKMINARLQGGRLRSVVDGRNYIATRPPYGYLIRKEGKGNRYLVPQPEQALVVKMIFAWYTDDDPDKRMGSSKIANELNRMNYKSYTGKPWTSSSVLAILKNPVYAGQIVWKKKEIKKSTVPGKKRDTRTRPKNEWIVVEGKHEPLVSMETFQKAQEILAGKYHVPYQLVNGITNPLAGLVKCDMCGSSMVLRPYSHQKYPHLMCYNRHCPNKSARFEYVERAVISGLRDWLKNYRAQWGKHRQQTTRSDDAIQLKQTALQHLERELKELEAQKERLHELLERGIYDTDTYLERSRKVAEKLENVRTALTRANQDLAEEIARQKSQAEIIPKVEHVLDLYYKTDDPAKKNNLLKSVLEYATYKKEKHQHGDNFTLVLYPKLPKNPTVSKDDSLHR